MPRESCRPIPLPRFRAELLALYDPPARSRRTRAKMRTTLDRLATLGVASTAELTPPTVARLVASMAGCRAETVRGYLAYLKAACNYALHMGYLRASPFGYRRDWVRPGPARDRPHHSREAIARVLASLEAQASTWEGHRLYALAAVYAYTGLRLTEALCLQARDVDLELGVLRVEARAVRLKTVAAAAPVPIPPPLSRILAGWLPRCGSTWAFPAKRRDRPWLHGGPGCRPTHRLVAAGAAVGVPGFTPLSLRHSFATHAEWWGLPELMVQRILRHADVRTQRRYRHADLRNLAASVRAVAFPDPPPPLPASCAASPPA